MTATDGGWRNEGTSYASSCSALWTAGTGTSTARDQIDRLIIGTAALHTGIGSHHLGRNVIYLSYVQERVKAKEAPANDVQAGLYTVSVMAVDIEADAMQRITTKIALRTPSNEPCYLRWFSALPVVTWMVQCCAVSPTQHCHEQHICTRHHHERQRSKTNAITNNTMKKTTPL